MESPVTLKEMLCFREGKVFLQNQLRNKHKEAVIVALGMNIPGPTKSSSFISEAFATGEDALLLALEKNGLNILEEIEVKKKEGYLKIAAVESKDATAVKRITVSIEESHPLGRLFDMDVYDQEGKGIGREVLGAPVRSCLLCKKEAKVCARSRSHTVEELYQYIETMIKAWLREK